MTFTNRAAFEMRDRVSGAAGPDCALPDVGNLHHFCRRFLLSVRRIHPGKHVLDESQQLDFVRMQSVADDEHEETIRAILVKKNLPDEYESRLRMIIFARAKRNPKV